MRNRNHLRAAASMTLMSTLPLFISIIGVLGAASSPADAVTKSPEQTVEEKAKSLLGEWRDRFDKEQFSYVAAGPFVIAGDAGPARLKQYRDGTILAATRALNATYFDTA